MLYNSLSGRQDIVCSDGFTMSINANKYCYCSPRDDIGPYLSVEIGFPSEVESFLLDYAQDRDIPTKTVYPWVPVKVVTLVIAKHGGIVSGSLPAGIPYLQVENKGENFNEKKA